MKWKPFHRFTLSYARYASTDPRAQFAVDADGCNLCRNTIFVESDTTDWKLLRDATKDQMPDGWVLGYASLTSKYASKSHISGHILVKL